MSNQRVVVLTDEELRHGEAFVRAAASVEAEPSTREALEHTPVGSFIRKLTAALEHPEGITDNQARLAGEWLYRWRWPSDPELEQYGDRWTESGREMLEAAFFPGDGEL